MGFREPPFDHNGMIMYLQPDPPDPPPALIEETSVVVGLDDLTWSADTYNDEPITSFDVEIDYAGPDIVAPIFSGPGLDDATSSGTFVGDVQHVYLVTIDHEGTGPDISAAVFTGAGLDDATSGGSYTLFATHTYTVVISTAGGTDKFRWQKDAGALSAEISITGAAQNLSDGVQITFAATTGHTEADQWVITATYDADSFQWNVDGGGATGGVKITTAAQLLSLGVNITFAARLGHTLGNNWTITTAAIDTFKWRQDGGGYTANVAINALAQTLADAVTVTFLDKRHHTLGDVWSVSIKPRIKLWFDSSGVMKYINSNGTVT